MLTQLAGDFISMRNQQADLQRYKSQLEARLAEAEREEEEERRGARPRQQPTQEEVEKFVRLQSEKVRFSFRERFFPEGILNLNSCNIKVILICGLRIYP